MSNIGYRKKSLDSSNTSTYSISSSFKSIKSKTSELFKKSANNDQKERPKEPKMNMLVVTEYLSLR